MALRWTLNRLLPVALAASLACESVVAHGGVVEEDDLCVIKMNYLRAHFKVYQPRRTGHKQFCEDLPAASESVFVMEYLHDALRSMPIDFRIIRDVTGKGRFARIEDVEKIDDLASATVFHQASRIERDVFTVMHDFDGDGEFVGIVKVMNPETGKTHVAVFPFAVGNRGFGYWPLFIGILIVLQVQYLAMSGRLKNWMKGKWSRAATGLCVCLVLLTPCDDIRAAEAAFRVSYTTPAGPIQINKIHSWMLHIETANGEPVVNANIEISGGMPEHSHGLPTRPRVTEDMGGGNYRLDGMRFHMHGYWEIRVTVDTGERSSTVLIPLQL
jgi:hypothetical protein